MALFDHSLLLLAWHGGAIERSTHSLSRASSLVPAAGWQTTRCRSAEGGPICTAWPSRGWCWCRSTTSFSAWATTGRVGFLTTSRYRPTAAPPKTNLLKTLVEFCPPLASRLNLGVQAALGPDAVGNRVRLLPQKCQGSHRSLDRRSCVSNILAEHALERHGYFVLYTRQGNTFMTIENNDHQLFTSVAWDLAHEQLVLADTSGVVQIWNTYTESVRHHCLRLPPSLMVFEKNMCLLSGGSRSVFHPLEGGSL